VFDYPLTAAELHRYLVWVAASAGEVEGCLEAIARTTGDVVHTGGLWTLAGREWLVPVREGRTGHARRLWPAAVRYGRAIAALPFVRFVGVSGALAVNNVDTRADIDYFVITEPGRLWVTRALIVFVVRLAARCGHALCPNYLISDRAIVLQDRNLFTAHELVQLVPIAGLSAYRRLRDANRWAADFLPNADGPPRAPDRPEPPMGPARRLAERAGRSAVGSWMEAWEQRRKIRRFRESRGRVHEASFGREWCKGHFNQHGERVLAAYAARLAALDRVPR
jgi:hypothetical protein